MLSVKSDEARKEASEWGRLGEQITKEYLASKGFTVTETNWRCGNRLEIDLISQQGDVMVFIEVKTRNGKFMSPESAIDEKKIKQMVKAANAYLMAQEREYSARFDVALIEGTPTEHKLTYIEDAFVPPPSFR